MEDPMESLLSEIETLELEEDNEFIVQQKETIESLEKQLAELRGTPTQNHSPVASITVPANPPKLAVAPAKPAPAAPPSPKLAVSPADPAPPAPPAPKLAVAPAEPAPAAPPAPKLAVAPAEPVPAAPPAPKLAVAPSEPAPPVPPAPKLAVTTTAEPDTAATAPSQKIPASTPLAAFSPAQKLVVPISAQSAAAASTAAATQDVKVAETSFLQNTLNKAEIMSMNKEIKVIKTKRFDKKEPDAKSSLDFSFGFSTQPDVRVIIAEQTTHEFGTALPFLSRVMGFRFVYEKPGDEQNVATAAFYNDFKPVLDRKGMEAHKKFVENKLGLEPASVGWRLLWRHKRRHTRRPIYGAPGDGESDEGSGDDDTNNPAEENKAKNDDAGWDWEGSIVPMCADYILTESPKVRTKLVKIWKMLSYYKNYVAIAHFVEQIDKRPAIKTSMKAFLDTFSQGKGDLPSLYKYAIVDIDTIVPEDTPPKTFGLFGSKISLASAFH